MTLSKRLTACGLMAFITTTTQAESLHEYAMRKSAHCEQALNQPIYERWGELSTKTPSTASTAFAFGSLKVEQGNLVWSPTAESKITLVDSATFEDGYGIAKFQVSPDGSKVAYALSYKRQDLR